MPLFNKKAPTPPPRSNGVTVSSSSNNNSSSFDRNRDDIPKVLKGSVKKTQEIPGKI